MEYTIYIIFINSHYARVFAYYYNLFFCLPYIHDLYGALFCQELMYSPFP